MWQPLVNATVQGVWCDLLHHWSYHHPQHHHQLFYSIHHHPSSHVHHQSKEQCPWQHHQPWHLQHRCLPHQSPHPMSASHPQPTIWITQWHHQHVLLPPKQRLAMPAVRRHQPHAKSHCHCHRTQQKGFPPPPVLAAIPSMQAGLWPCTVMASHMTPSANKDDGPLTLSSCTSMSKYQHSLLAFPPWCLGALCGSTSLDHKASHHIPFKFIRFICWHHINHSQKHLLYFFLFSSLPSFSLSPQQCLVWLWANPDTGLLSLYHDLVLKSYKVAP